MSLEQLIIFQSHLRELATDYARSMIVELKEINNEFSSREGLTEQETERLKKVEHKIKPIPEEYLIRAFESLFYRTIGEYCRIVPDEFEIEHDG